MLDTPVMGARSPHLNSTRQISGHLTAKRQTDKGLGAGQAHSYKAEPGNDVAKPWLLPDGT